MSTLGERIKIIRNKREVTQKEFSERICVTQSYVSRLESDKEVPTDMLIKLISLEFSINYDWLQKGAGEPFVEESKDYDYWERGNAEGKRKGVCTALDSLSKNLERIANPSLDFQISTAILNIELLIDLYNQDQNFGITVVEQLSGSIVSFYDQVARINELDRNENQYSTKLYKHIWTAIDEMSGHMRQVGEAYINRTK